MANQKIILIIIILILLLGGGLFGFKYLAVSKELRQTQAALAVQKTNEKVLDFAKLFIGTVLKTDTEVDFETRLILENAVRNLKDEEILAQWQKFAGSGTEVQAQEEVKNLLEILVDKIK